MVVDVFRNDLERYKEFNCEEKRGLHKFVMLD